MTGKESPLREGRTPDVHEDIYRHERLLNGRPA
jgi:hypothetical protein